LVALLGSAAIAACEDPGVHVFSGQLFDTQGQCVDPSSTALDVISGAATGNNCAPACLVASSQVYVSTVCPPYPPGFSVEGADAAMDPADPCTGALAAFAAATTCGAASDTDGGGTQDATTGDDGTADAPGEAAPDGAGG
jgi:hypothetical protein